jgi:hypothetical protein
MPAYGAIAAAGTLANTYNSYKTSKDARKNQLSYTDALKQAQDRLGSLYDKNVTNQINSLDNTSANRGFYGQAAADQLKSNTIGDIRSDEASNIANLASQLQSGSQANALNSQNAFSNSLSNLGNIATQRANSGQGSGLWNYLLALGKNNSSGPTSGGIGGGVSMDNSGNIGYSIPSYGLGGGINSNYLKDWYSNQ